jgi:hypothetical protein
MTVVPLLVERMRAALDAHDLEPGFVEPVPAPQLD